MVITIVIKDDNGKQVKSMDFYAKSDENWEETSYRIGCKVAQESAQTMLKGIEENLSQKRDKKWKIHSINQRTMVTRFGDVTISRRLYKNKKKYRFPLDEHLNWQSYQRATPSLKTALVELSTERPFRRVSGTMEKLLAGVLTKSTIHNLLTEVSGKAIEGERSIHSSCFSQGKLPKGIDWRMRISYFQTGWTSEG